MEIKKNIVLAIVLLNLLASCTTGSPKDEEISIDNSWDISIDKEISINDSWEKLNLSSNPYAENISNTIKKENIVEKKLTIDERCIWCGKCVRFDPEHFKMNMSTFKAEVKTQDNLDTSALSSAINICPVDSISY